MAKSKLIIDTDPVNAHLPSLSLSPHPHPSSDTATNLLTMSSTVQTGYRRRPRPPLLFALASSSIPDELDVLLVSVTYGDVDVER